MDEETGLITPERAWKVIGEDRLALLATCHPAGWAAWEAIRSTKEGSDLSPTARAQIVHEGAVRQAKHMFPVGMWGTTQGLFALDMVELLCRFKKLDDDLAPRGIPTGQAVLFEEQGQMGPDAQMTIWSAAPMLIIGYVVDDFGLSIRRQVLVLRRNGEVLWARDLPSAQDGLAPAPPVVTPPSAPPAAEVRSTRPPEEERPGGEVDG